VRLRVGLLATLLGAAVVTPAAAPAMPYAWVFMGEGLEAPVAIVGWESSERIVQGFHPNSVAADSLRGRASLAAATLSQPDWESFGSYPTSEALRARATYRFYPASGDGPALLMGATRTWSFSTDVAEFLRSQGVPTLERR
jgi:hypothetical protein